MKTSKYFVTGKNNINWVDSDFTKEFGDHTIELVEDFEPQIRKLEKYMTLKQMQNEFKPEEITISDLVHILKTSDKLLKDGCANIFFIKGSKWAVDVLWGSDGWGVCAFSVERPLKWDAGRQVLSRRFLDTENKTFSPSDALPLELVINGVKYRKV